MNCAEFDESVHDLDRRATAAGPPGVGVVSNVADGPSGTSAISDAALAHAESCSRCARVLTEIEGLNFALRAIATRDAQEHAPAEVETALLRAFRKQAVTFDPQRESNPQIAGRLRSWGWYAAIAAAAIVLLAVGLMRGWVGTPPPLQPVANPTGTIAGTATGSKAPLASEEPAVSPESRATANASGRAPQAAQATDDATAFYALPYADDVASIEGGAVIRVSLPRSTLAAWGLPIQGLEQAGAIPADLLVSADGTPQAIRLVSSANE
ncbi:MAG: hypothetical protein ACRD8A_10240 [Candidatus Acidiferrales bacterium]